ncbi:helix-turn-helix domain-containing protein [Kitasatospora sp. NPDC058444]|uniref:helix-turn-helix domain-containing protein n=1 Tax=Kitasatospora sp. NPDC058444 TaxID=3346504 RepID=UPI003657E2A0
MSWQIQAVSPPLPSRSEEFFHLALAADDSVLVTGEGDEIPLEAGDLVFCDPGRPRSPRFADEGRVTVFRLPRRCLELSEADCDRLAGMTARGGDGLGALVSGFLAEIATGTRDHSPNVLHRLTRTAMDLLVVLVMELLQTEREDFSTAARDELLAQVRNYIEDHLADPDLSPQAIARANHISVRYLHRIFQREGVTVGQWLRQRRLESCRQDLRRTPNRRITVSAVANRWGFVSASHFSRAFRDEFGMSPSEWQALR